MTKTTTPQSQEYRTDNMILTVYPSGTNYLHTRVNNKDWDQWKFTAINHEKTVKVLRQIIKINQG